jgi:glycosyltransferase involved in cell wall biosynthesis
VKVVMVSKALVRGTYQRKLEEIAAAGIELTLVTPPSWREGRAGIPLERRHTRGYDLVVTPIAFNGRYHLHFYPRLGGILRAIRPDLVHVDEEPYNLATVLALRAAGSVGARRLFFTWQNLYRRLPLPFALLERQSYRLAHGAIAGVDDAAAVLRRKGFRAPTWVIPQFGVDPEIFRPGPPRVADGFTVGFLGRLVPEKGVDLLIRAAAALDRPWRLLLAGTGPEQARLLELARSLGIADRVEFVGGMPSDRVPGFLRRLDVLVLPSRSIPSWREQFGRALVEAMASEVPVVGSTCGEIPRVIGDAGLVFAEDRPDQLAESLRRLQRDPALRAELGRKGRIRVRERFTQRRVAAQTVEVYRALGTASLP